MTPNGSEERREKSSQIAYMNVPNVRAAERWRERERESGAVGFCGLG